MRPVFCEQRNDGALVAAIARFYEAIAPYKMSIRAAYQSYSGTSCSGLKPIELSDEAQAAMRRAYESEAKTAKLDWISKVRSSHSFNFCPVCGGPGARTVEHHLPKTHFPEFSVFSWNLIPCCAACNSKRGDSNKPGARWTLHPYFDHGVLGRPLVYIEIVKPWLAPMFKMRVCEELPLEIRDVVGHHLKKSLDLDIFGSWIRGQWGDLLTLKAPHYASSADFRLALRNELQGESIRSINSWNAALVRGILRTDGLCAWMIDNCIRSPHQDDAALGIG